MKLCKNIKIDGVVVCPNCKESITFETYYKHYKRWKKTLLVLRCVNCGIWIRTDLEERDDEEN